ncbi:unnamed protein product [Hymenolepis diminuta]|uniref:Uncharacterized protein n=1 Tax=Hymenolepis diminuta TaxID=6216 RepID=A0A564Z804_HYMDI|nr:unnamed protein product [Hymenolepis diminuta]
MAESLDHNCKQPPKITNSSTEFDTELFQTDIQELSQELPEHADDSNLVRDDGYDFLLEHATASRKSRGKRKKKTPKSTAVNHQKPSVTQHRSPKYQLLLYQREQTTRINPAKTIPINMPTSSQPPSTKLQVINHKLRPPPLPYQRRHSRGNVILAIYLQSIISQNSAWSRRRKKGLQMHENLNPEIKQPNRHQLLSTTACKP